ncbi:MAG: exosortase [Sedimentisphaerales bacterium]|nr:exosortase [Sedimentisphaerales bacterium]
MSYKKENIKAVILAGENNIYAHSMTKSLSTLLWPVVGKSLLERLLLHLSDQGIKQAVICCDTNSELLRKLIGKCDYPELEFIEESLPLGSAGCIRAAAANDKEALLLVFTAGIICLPNIDLLVKQHQQGKADLTVMFNPSGQDNKVTGEFAGVYVCQPSVLEYIPQDGYFDIKEGLIPGMLKAEKSVHAAVLPERTGNFRNWQEYLYAVEDYLENRANKDLHMQIFKEDNSRIIWTGDKTNIHSNARLCGPVVIMEGTTVSENAVIFGPAILGRNVTINEGCVIVNSILWDNAKVGKNCEIQRCVVDNNIIVGDNKIVEDEFVGRNLGQIIINSTSKHSTVKRSMNKSQSVFSPKFSKADKLIPDALRSNSKMATTCLAGGLLIIALLWSYWPNFTDIWKIWQSSDEYSSGILVPFLAIYILWSKRDKISQVVIKPSVFGLFAFAGTQAFRFFGLYYMYSSAERLSIVMSIAALVLFIFGWRFFWKVFTVLLFLFLMLPWPNRVQAAVALPLQNWATSSAVFCLETVGYEVVREGNTIHIGQTVVAVAEACNGLRMITAFLVISGMVVLLVNRKWWEKLIILISSLPIALFCNTVRLVVTSIAFTILKGEYWERIFHDFGGYAMMPLALGLIVIELLLLTKLTTEPTKQETIIVKKKKS